MFGYILPEKPEMKMKEYDVFRAFYCGICKSIATRIGQIPRMVLNYDFTFLAILLSSAIDIKPEFNTERCIAHPASKRLMARKSKIIDYAADMNVILAYYKLKDDWNDEHSVKAIVGTLLLQSAFNKLKKNHTKKCEVIKNCLDELSALEAAKCSNVDMIAEPFAKLMQNLAICDNVTLSEKDSNIISWIGYNIGKWIYIIDAYNDIEQDIKEGSYNPFVLSMPNGSTSQEIKNSVKKMTEFNLTYTLSEISKAYELLSKNLFSPITENIVYLGMLRKTENILGIGSCKNIEKSV